MFDRPQRLHPAAIVIKFGAYFVSTFKSLIVPVGALLFSGRNSGAQYLTLMIGLSIAGLGAVSLIGPVLHFFSTSYMIEGDALVISSGFIWRKRRTIPLARIQNVNIERTLWHRILGAAAVKVETAAGGQTEGDLTALSVSDANLLQAALLERREVSALEAEPEAPAPLYSLTLKQVLLAGALGNRVLYILASMFAVFQFEGSSKFLRPLYNYMQRLSPVLFVVVGMLTFLVLILIGWLLSVGISATRFFGFRIMRHERGLLLTHGLVTQFKTIVPTGRIQDVRIVEPILFRALGYCEVYADTAGSFDRKDVASANKICPILPEEEVDQIGKLLLPEFSFGELDWKRVSSRTVLRHAVRGFISWAVLLAVPLGFWLKWNALWFALPLAIVSLLMGLAYYQYVGYSFTGDVLAARSGVLRKHAVIVPFDRIQHYTINSTFFQRRMGLATVVAVSASSAGHPIHIVDMEAADAERLRQTIGQAINRHLGSRRGGL